MASNMSVGASAITGQESYWGDVNPTPGAIKIVNASPTLQSQLHDYENDVKSGKMNPMTSASGMGTFFVGDNGDDGGSIVFGQGEATSGDDERLVGTLAHELGHYENRANDQAFKDRYAVNKRDPEAYNVAALSGIHGEGEAVENNWQVQRESEVNTGNGRAPGIGAELSPNELADALTQQHFADVRANKSNAQDRNHLIVTGMNGYANQNPSTAPNESYYKYYGQASGSRPHEPGRPTVAFTGDDNGDINSMTEHWPSGDVGTQTFNEGKIQSSIMVNKAGKLISDTAYQYNKDGGYSVAVTDGAGQKTRYGEFNADQSGTVREYTNDGSSAATLFNGDNQNVGKAHYDTTGEKTDARYWDPDTKGLTNQYQRLAGGGRAVFNYDTEGHARSRFEYDRDGKPVSSADFDANGNSTFAVRYNKDGSRTVASFNRDGTQTSHIVDRNGNRGKDFKQRTPIKTT